MLLRNGQQQVYYGFSPNFLKWGKDNLTNFDEWMADMKRLLSQEGVIYKGEFRGLMNTVEPKSVKINHAIEGILYLGTPNKTSANPPSLVFPQDLDQPRPNTVKASRAFVDEASECHIRVSSCGH